MLAIAITLLVLDINLPLLAPGQTLTIGLLSCVAADFLDTRRAFLVIGIYWANHHYMFNLIRCNHWLLLLNLRVSPLHRIAAYLSTALVSAYLQNPGARRTAVFVYQGTILAYTVFLQHQCGDTRVPDIAW